MMNPILAEPSFRAELQEIARNSGKSFVATEQDAALDFKEMHGRRSKLAIRAFAALGRFVYRRGYPQEPIFDFDELAKVRRESQARSVVFLATHKTYLDFFVLFDFLYRNGISTPYIFGGVNMNFAGFGALARRAGGIFIRRTFKDDPVYKAVLRQYTKCLIQSGACFMWAIEGTRSRTGKLVMPRLGLLNYVGGISRSLGDDAVAYIPVSVTYDQIPDVIDMAAEEAGASKSPESLSWFMRYVRGMDGPFGDIHIRFGDAMNLSDTPDAPDLAASDGLVDESQIEIQKLAFEACYRINEITPATTSSLVLMALLCRGSSTVTRVRQDVADLKDHIRRMVGRVLSHRISRLPEGTPESSLVTLRSAGILTTSSGGAEASFAIAPGKMSVAIYYSNMAVHHFVVCAIVELALMRVAQAASPAPDPALCPAAQFWAECLELRNLFKFEFFFSRKDVFNQQLQTELESLDDSWSDVLQEGGHRIEALLEQQNLLVAFGVLSPFIRSYKLVAHILLQRPEAAQMSDKELVRACLDWIQVGSEDQQPDSTEGVSRALLNNGLLVADSHGLRKSGAADLQQRRAEFLKKLVSVSDALLRLKVLSDQSSGSC